MIDSLKFPAWYSFHICRNTRTGEQFLLLFEEKTRGNANDKKFSSMKLKPADDELICALITCALCPDAGAALDIVDQLADRWGALVPGREKRQIGVRVGNAR